MDPDRRRTGYRGRHRDRARLPDRRRSLTRPGSPLRAGRDLEPSLVALLRPAPDDASGPPARRRARGGKIRPGAPGERARAMGHRTPLPDPRRRSGRPRPRHAATGRGEARGGEVHDRARWSHRVGLRHPHVPHHPLLSRPVPPPRRSAPACQHPLRARRRHEHVGAAGQLVLPGVAAGGGGAHLAELATAQSARPRPRHPGPFGRSTRASHRRQVPTTARSS